MVEKIGIYFVLFIPACVVAGVYGALHNQLSYWLSPEYFSHYKFIQFSMPWAQSTPRLAAALVGFFATWWVGALIYLILGFIGFKFTTAREMAKVLLRAFVIVLGVALLTGLLSLLFGYVFVNSSNVDNYSSWVSPGVEDTIQFVRVSLLHNASYLGGLAGLITGILYLLKVSRR